MSNPESPTAAQVDVQRATDSRHFVSGGRLIEYDELLSRYIKSDFGKHHMEQRARFAGLPEMAYDRDQMLIDLGDDVHPVFHMSHTHDDILMPLIRTQRTTSRPQFTPLGISAMRFGALLHDIGECTHPKIAREVGGVVGDIPAPLKTKEHEILEKEIRHYLYSELYPDIADRELNLAELIIIGKSHHLPVEGFQMVERLGYYLTAMQAGRLAIEGKRSGAKDHNPRLKSLGALGVKVSRDYRSVLDEAANKFKYIEHQMLSTLDHHQTLHNLLGHKYPEPAEKTTKQA